MSTTNLNEVLEDIFTYLKISKDLGQLLTGAGSFVNCYNPNTHRLHGKVDSLGAATGRMTHNSPNITQLSKDQAFRELMTVPNGKLLVDVDADALELVMMGHYLGPYDNYEFAKAVDSGSKEDGTDIHTLNQKRVGLPSRDAAKTFIYATIYGAGASKLGAMCWDKNPFEYTNQEYQIAKESVLKKTTTINGELYFPTAKGTLAKYDENIILETIYGTRITQAFRDNTRGYKELQEASKKLVKNSRIKAIDGRLLYLRSEHKTLNLLLQSAGAIFMKYYLVEVDKQLSSRWTHGKEYAYVANIHDALNLEIIPQIKYLVNDILKKAFTTASIQLGLKYPVKGKPHFGLNQYETH